MLIFDVPTLEDFEAARIERNKDIAGYRTAHQITKAEQEAFAARVTNSAYDRFWAVKEGSTILALAGFERIEWEHGNAETSLVFLYEKPNGELIYRALLDKGFNELRLTHIYTQVYLCSPMLMFYIGLGFQAGASMTDLPIGKYWNGQYYGSRLVVFSR